MQISRLYRDQIVDLLQAQLTLISEADAIDLGQINLTTTEGDNPFVANLKKALADKQANHDVESAVKVAELMPTIQQLEQSFLKQVRFHRREAEKCSKQAEELFNGRAHLIHTGDIIPLALALDLIPSEQLAAVNEHIAKVKPKNYLTEVKAQKRVKASD